MVKSRLLSYLLLCAALLQLPLSAHNYLLEFKGAGFFPTGSCFKEIYGKAAPFIGYDFTFNICDNWYGFTTVDFMWKHGHSIGLCTPTKVLMMPIGFGVKYLYPVCYGNLYAGLGVEAVCVRTEECSEAMFCSIPNWGVGGVAKVGMYIDLYCNLALDLFLDYRFTKISGDDCFSCLSNPIKADLSGVVAGVGIVFKFN